MTEVIMEIVDIFSELSSESQQTLLMYIRVAHMAESSVKRSIKKAIANGYGVEKAMLWLEKAATQGMPQAQFNLGVLYHDNHDYKQAVEWYSKAEEQGHPNAQGNLGLCMQMV